MPKSITFFCFFALLFSAPILGAQTASRSFPLNNFSVKGNARYSLAALLQASGLGIGKPIDESAMQQAYQRLWDTGLFRSLRYSFTPTPNRDTPGYDLVFEVSEGPARAVVIDIPGFETGAFWHKMADVNPLLLPEIPETEQAQSYYEREFTRILSQSGRNIQVRGSVESDLDTGKSNIVFHLEDAPSIAGLRFRGANAVAPADLEMAMRTALGTRYSPRSLRRMIDLNLMPLYANRGYLATEFAIEEGTASGASVRPEVRISEGVIYKIRSLAVTLDGNDSPEHLKAAALKTGAPAHWDRIEEAAQRARRELLRLGYLKSHAEIRKSLDSTTSQVDLTVALQRGPQFTAGQLILQGFPAKAEATARKNWKLSPGAPFDQIYADDYVKKALALDDLRNVRGVSIEVRPKGQTVDYHIVLK